MSNQKRLSSEEFVPLINYHAMIGMTLHCHVLGGGLRHRLVRKQASILKNAALFDPFDLSHSPLE